MYHAWRIWIHVNPCCDEVGSERDGFYGPHSTRSVPRGLLSKILFSCFWIALFGRAKDDAQQQIQAVLGLLTESMMPRAAG